MSSGVGGGRQTIKTEKEEKGQTEGVITNSSPNQCVHLLISLCLFNTNITVLLKKQ